MAEGKSSNISKKVGYWAFIIGLVIAALGGILSALGPGMETFFMTAVIIILIILGLIVGSLSITAKEIMLFMVATITLVVVGGVFAPLQAFGNILDSILRLIAALMAPAAVVAVLKALWVVVRPG